MLNKNSQRVGPTPPVVLWPFSVGGRLILSFGLICALLAALGASFFFSLGSIRQLYEKERASSQRDVGNLQLINKHVDLQQAQILHQMVETDAAAWENYEKAIARLGAANAKGLEDYRRFMETKEVSELYAVVRDALQVYNSRTAQLLDLSRQRKTSEATAFAIETQVSAYDQYQTALKALLDAEKAEGNAFAEATAQQIHQAYWRSVFLVGLGIVLVFATGVSVWRILGTFRDDKRILGRAVEENEQAYNAVREADQKYRSMFDNASEGIFQNTPEGNVLAANPALARMLGFDSPEELVNTRTDLAQQAYVDPGKRAELQRLLRENGGVVNNHEYQVKRKDGSVIWISENVRAIRDADGKDLYYEGSVQDITARKEAVARIAEQAALLDKAHDAIMVRGLDDRLSFWNKGAERLFGYNERRSVRP